jgi:predicted DsbA family dithiol-disulfide isomerase
VSAEPECARPSPELLSSDSTLDEGRFTDEVLADEAEVQRLGLSGVPALVVGPADGPLEQGYPLQGAQPYETVAAVVEQVARDPRP